MGIEMSVYVGPYLVVSDIDNGQARILTWKHCAIVQDGRGEAGVNESELYVIPNIEGFGWTVDSDCGPTPFDGKVITATTDFWKATRLFRDDVAAAGGSVRVELGIVPGWF